MFPTGTLSAGQAPRRREIIPVQRSRTAACTLDPVPRKVEAGQSLGMRQTQSWDQRHHRVVLEPGTVLGRLVRASSGRNHLRKLVDTNGLSTCHV